MSKGRAQFRVQSSGQWLVNVFHKAPVTKDGPMKEFGDKSTSVGYGATLTFNVKEWPRTGARVKNPGPLVMAGKRQEDIIAVQVNEALFRSWYFRLKPIASAKLFNTK